MGTRTWLGGMPKHVIFTEEDGMILLAHAEGVGLWLVGEREREFV